MDMLLNAGPMHNALAELNYARSKPIFGSSANLSLTGSKYRVADIDESVCAAADIVIDHGTSKYANDEGLSSTIIDFRDFSVVRRSEEHTSELQLMRISYAVFCLKIKQRNIEANTHTER